MKPRSGELEGRRGHRAPGFLGRVQAPKRVSHDPGVGIRRVRPPTEPALAALVGENLGDRYVGEAVGIFGQRDAEVVGQIARHHEGHEAARELLGAAIGVLDQLLHAVSHADEGRRRDPHVEPSHVVAKAVELADALRDRVARLAIEGRGFERRGSVDALCNLHGIGDVPRARAERQLGCSHARRGHRPAHLDAAAGGGHEARRASPSRSC